MPSANASARAIQNGWLHTGDIARIDEHGYVYLLDRLKDLIVSGGENIYTSEVEAAIHRHPAVAECAVIGVPDERLGEAPFAVIQVRPGQKPGEAEIVEQDDDDVRRFRRRAHGVGPVSGRFEVGVGDLTPER